MLKNIVMSAAFVTTFGLAAVACDAEDVETHDRLLQDPGLCLAAAEDDAARLELRDANVAATVVAESDVPESVYVEYEGAMVELRDDGKGPDRTANDGIFTAESDEVAPPSRAFCLPGSEGQQAAADELATPQEPGQTPDEPWQRPQGPDALQNDLDPQALPANGGYCHDWKYAWSGAVQVWYCDCFAWDIWSC